MNRNTDSSSPAAAPSTPSSTAAQSSVSGATPAQPSAQANQRPPRLALLIATGFGLGYLPKAPGTWGSLGGVILVGGMPFILTLSFSYLFGPGAHPKNFLGFEPYIALYVAMSLLTSVLGVLSSTVVARFQGNKDPQHVVIDEVTGQQIALLPAAWADSITVFYTGIAFGWFPYWKYLLAGFILFRVFDIWKPWPVRQAEKLPGGWGIMADDWVAGIYAALCLWALRVLGM
jgi:phosphatidylglycerophosphatase A